jgi:hypothetical protein
MACQEEAYFGLTGIEWNAWRKLLLARMECFGIEKSILARPEWLGMEKVVFFTSHFVPPF